MKRIGLVILAGLAAAVFCHGIFPKPTVKQEGFNEKSVVEYFDDVHAALATLEGQAIGFLGNEKATQRSPGLAFHYIQVLGRLRSTKAIKVLSDQLLYKQQTAEIGKGVPPEKEYPACGALIKIGLPAAKGLVERIVTKETSEEYRKMAFFVCREVVGDRKVPWLLDTLLEEDPSGRKSEFGRYRDKVGILKKEYQKLSK